VDVLQQWTPLPRQVNIDDSLWMKTVDVEHLLCRASICSSYLSRNHFYNHEPSALHTLAPKHACIVVAISTTCLYTMN